MEDRIQQLEDDVLNMLLAGDDPVLAVLRAQLERSKRTRRFSGAGFFADFFVAKETPRLAGAASFSFGDVIGAVEGLQYGAGFVLFVEEGILKMLEGYSYEEPWPAIITNYKLSYMTQGARDMMALRANPGWPSQAQ